MGEFLIPTQSVGTRKPATKHVLTIYKPLRGCFSHINWKFYRLNGEWGVLKTVSGEVKRLSKGRLLSEQQLKSGPVVGMLKALPAKFLPGGLQGVSRRLALLQKGVESGH